jgi:hypothetical protein
VSANELLVTLIRIRGSDPTVCRVEGDCGVEDLQMIERDESVAQAGEFDGPDGYYTYRAHFFSGQYGDFGRCEIAPHIDLEQVAFTPLDMVQPTQPEPPR